MVRTSSTMLPLGTQLPYFDLSGVPGTRLDDDFQGLKSFSSKMFFEKPLLLMIICAHCPFVKHIESGITNLHIDYQKKVQFVAVSSNSLITHPQDGPKFLSAQANSHGWTFPYLFDESQSLAISLKAACTPDFFLFAPSSKGQQLLKYRGQMDGSRPGNKEPVTARDLRSAIDIVLSGQTTLIDQKPSIGCNIKWHPGKEPPWYG